MKNEALIKEYVSAVSGAVICNSKKKRRLLAQLRQDAEAFVAENEGATRQELEAFLGSPEVIAASVIVNSESSEIKSNISLRKTVAAAVLAALLIYLIFVAVSLVDVHIEAHGYIEEGIMCVFNSCMKGGAV